MAQWVSADSALQVRWNKYMEFNNDNKKQANSILHIQSQTKILKKYRCIDISAVFDEIWR